MEKEFEVDFKEHSPEDYPLWYDQFAKLPEKAKKDIAHTALKRIASTKPEMADFIRKMRCELVGLCPRIEYILADEREGETDVTWVHGFSIPTLLYWCKEGKFGFFVNANLDYNDTVLNKVNGNKRQSLKGFTA